MLIFHSNLYAPISASRPVPPGPCRSLVRAFTPPHTPCTFSCFPCLFVCLVPSFRLVRCDPGSFSQRTPCPTPCTPCTFPFFPCFFVCLVLFFRLVRWHPGSFSQCTPKHPFTPWRRQGKEKEKKKKKKKGIQKQNLVSAACYFKRTLRRSAAATTTVSRSAGVGFLCVLTPVSKDTTLAIPTIVQKLRRGHRGC